jgi:hypothetical protein
MRMEANGIRVGGAIRSPIQSLTAAKRGICGWVGLVLSRQQSTSR